MARAKTIMAAAAVTVGGVILIGCSPSPPATTTDDASADPAYEPEDVDSAESPGNVVPVGPPDVRARALGVDEDRIEAIQDRTRRWWQGQGKPDRVQVCRQLTNDPTYMADWMRDTDLPAGAEQELAAQTLIGMTDAFCWRYR